jgi:hypothetical protein
MNVPVSCIRGQRSRSSHATRTCHCETTIGLDALHRFRASGTRVLDRMRFVDNHHTVEQGLTRQHLDWYESLDIRKRRGSKGVDIVDQLVERNQNCGPCCQLTGTSRFESSQTLTDIEESVLVFLYHILNVGFAFDRSVLYICPLSPSLVGRTLTCRH